LPTIAFLAKNFRSAELRKFTYSIDWSLTQNEQPNELETTTNKNSPKLVKNKNEFYTETLTDAKSGNILNKFSWIVYNTRMKILIPI
jgi:hypothetical protein